MKIVDLLILCQASLLFTAHQTHFEQLSNDKGQQRNTGEADEPQDESNEQVPNFG